MNHNHRSKTLVSCNNVDVVVVFGVDRPMRIVTKIRSWTVPTYPKGIYDWACTYSPKWTKNQEQMANNRHVVVAQLVERSLPIPEIRCLNPVITINSIKNWNWKDENKEKEGGNGPIIK